MTPEMLEAFKAYLKENLSISVEVNEDWGSFSGGATQRVSVKVVLDNETIAEDSDTFTVGTN